MSRPSWEITPQIAFIDGEITATQFHIDRAEAGRPGARATQHRAALQDLQAVRASLVELQAIRLAGESRRRLAGRPYIWSLFAELIGGRRG